MRCIESDVDNDGSYIIVKCEVRGQLYTLVNVYNHKLKTDVLDKITPYLQESAEGVLVIGGDFNTPLNPHLDRTSTTQNNQHASLQKCVERVTASLHLVDIWRRINPTEGEYTYYKKDSMSRLDYIFMQKESMWRVKACEILDPPEEYSDHKPVWLQLTSAPQSVSTSTETADMNKDKAKISLMSWNIHGLQTKVAYVTEEAENNKCDIVFLQETHIRPQDADVYDELKEWECYFSKYDSRKKGVAILIKKHDGFECTESDVDPDGSYIILKCVVRGQPYTLVNVYNHKLDTDVLDKLILYLQECAEGVLVIGGDFNTPLNPYMDRTSKTENIQQDKLRKCAEKFIASIDLVDVWRTINPTEIEYTYHKKNNMSRLDYIFMQEESMWRVKACKILETPEGHSDHKPVRLQLTSEPSNHGLPPMPFNDSIEASDDDNYHFFNVDYLIFATILARHLEKNFKEMTKQTLKNKWEIKDHLIMKKPSGGNLRLKWSLLEEAIKALEDPILDSIIFEKLLSESEPGLKQLRRGCPLTPVLLTLYCTHLASMVQKTYSLTFTEHST
ncbi:hypothetical protein SKAU_G00140870 [Synaphobranchus kaupii]|uniref:exodeoxyribonuclease III n=1 Tax=Synaphobranchus kaupii TaxID=118154 RepID=A0A9Q1J3Z6_SYNKA|nr:hypothetical protein SKAU_G00140870 [Synaphobranchus kaupii]